jgi:hypothetical protein
MKRRSGGAAAGGPSDPADRGLQNFKCALLDGEPVEKDDIEHDPADWEEPRDRAQNSRAQRHAGRHGEQKIAITLATISAMIAAMCAFTLLDAIRTNSVTTGRAAAIVDKTVLLNGS